MNGYVPLKIIIIKNKGKCITTIGSDKEDTNIGNENMALEKSYPNSVETSHLEDANKDMSLQEIIREKS